MRRATLLLTVPLVILLFGHAPGAWACSCVGGLTQQEYREMADVVFVGVVTGSEDPGEGEEVVSSGRPIRWTFEVRRSEKGEAGDTIVVRSAADEASCGYSFRTERRYRVYATEDGGAFHTGLCSGNEDLGEASARQAEPVATTEPAVTTGPVSEPDPDRPVSPDEPVSEPDPARGDGGPPPTTDAEPIALPGQEVGDDRPAGRNLSAVLAVVVIVLAGAGLALRRRFSRP